MKRSDGKSDQSYNWSDRNGISVYKITPASSRTHSSSSVNEARDSSGFINRAIQEVRQGGLQMCTGAGTRPQVLSIGEHAGTSSEDDIRAPGLRRTGRGASCQYEGGPRASGGDLRNQPGAIKTEGENLKYCVGICVAPKSPGIYRSCVGRNSGGQYDSGLPLCGIGSGGNR